MHSGSHKSMLFWRWTMGFNANPKTIHDWLWWFSVGTVLSSAIGIISTGTITHDWYVWGVDNGWVQQYGPITRDAINGRPEAPAVTSREDQRTVDFLTGGRPWAHRTQRRRRRRRDNTRTCASYSGRWSSR